MANETEQTENHKNELPKKELLPIKAGNRGLELRSIEDFWRFADAICRSGLCPDAFKNQSAVMVALQGGAELGLSPMQSMQNLVVVNGKLGMFAVMARALVESSPVCEYVQDNMNELSGITEWNDTVTATVVCKRKGRPEPVRRSFSVADAKRAGLWGKKSKQGNPSTWILYPGRMLYARALGFALNDAFGDILRNIRTVEEVQDYPNDRPQQPVLTDGQMIASDELDAIATEIDAEERGDEIDAADTIPDEKSVELATESKAVDEPQQVPDVGADKQNGLF